MTLYKLNKTLKRLRRRQRFRQRRVLNAKRSQRRSRQTTNRLYHTRRLGGYQLQSMKNYWGNVAEKAKSNLNSLKSSLPGIIDQGKANMKTYQASQNRESMVQGNGILPIIGRRLIKYVPEKTINRIQQRHDQKWLDTGKQAYAAHAQRNSRYFVPNTTGNSINHAPLLLPNRNAPSMTQPTVSSNKKFALAQKNTTHLVTNPLPLRSDTLSNREINYLQTEYDKSHPTLKEQLNKKSKPKVKNCVIM